MGTIVQEYGPIYGEAVNGTVSGRPNGSVYVPMSNTITLRQVTVGTPQISKSSIPYPYRVYSNIGFDIVAQSQDLASYIQQGIFTDAACENLFGTLITNPAGIFNISNKKHVGNNSDDAPDVGETYYLRAFLVNNGVVIAASEVIEVEGA